MNHTNPASEKLSAMKQRYLVATFEREDALTRWKRRESARSAMLTFVWISIFAGIVAAGLLWFFNRNAEGYTEFIYAGCGLAGGILLAIIFGIIRAIVTKCCEKPFAKYYDACINLRNVSDSIKITNTEDVLQNTIIINVRAMVAAGVDRKIENRSAWRKIRRFEKKIAKHDKKIKQKNKNQNRTVRDGFSIRRMRDAVKKYYLDNPDYTSLDSVTVFIDNVEVGALDLSSDFSVFRVNPGLHSVKLRICKQYYANFYTYSLRRRRNIFKPRIRKDDVALRKQLDVETPVVSATIGDDYHILSYILHTDVCDQVVSYQLDLAEYDDITIFHRDLHKPDAMQAYKADLSNHLYKRFEKLSDNLKVRRKYEQTFSNFDDQLHRHEEFQMPDLAVKEKKFKKLRHRVRALQLRILKVQAKERMSDKRRQKRIAALNLRIDDAITHFCLTVPDFKEKNILLTKFHKSHLKNILLYGEDNVRYETLASECSKTQQDARLKNYKQPQVNVNIHN